MSAIRCFSCSPFRPVRRWRSRLLLMGIGLCLATGASAGDYSDRDAASAVITAAEEAGVDPEWARQLIDAAQRQQSILEAIARPAEKTKAWHEYRLSLIHI